MAEELKPCPFCGGDPVQEYGIDGDPYVVCVDCGASVEGTLAAWNTRAPDPELTTLRMERDANHNLAVANGLRAREEEARSDAMEKANAALRARVKDLEEGLAPFSEMAGELFARNYNISDVVLTLPRPDEGPVAVTFGDFNRARTLLKGAAS